MKETYSLLKGIYFHEQDVREKIITRVQINLGIYITFFAMFAYMVRMMDYDSNMSTIVFFYICSLCFLALIFVSIKHSKSAFVGMEYRNFPRATEVLEYKKKLINHANDIEEYNKSYDKSEIVPDPDYHTEQFTFKWLTKCIDHNAHINESRRISIKRSIKWLVLSVIPLSMLSTVFVIADLDVSSPRKHTLIKDDGVSQQIEIFSKQISSQYNQLLIQQIEATMSDEKNEAPPPPPPSMPVEPTWQISTEDAKDVIADDSHPINEG